MDSAAARGWLLEAGRGLLWLLYARDPGGRPPRRWRGLVGYGRLDIAARFLLAALYPEGRYNGDTLLLYLDREGEGLRGRLLVLGRDCLPSSMAWEREAATVLLEALRSKRCRTLGETSLRGVVLAARRAGRRVLLLHETGHLLAGEPVWDRVMLVVGSRIDPPLRGPGYDAVVRVGCRSYLASSVAAYINLLRLKTLSGGGDVG